MPPDFIDRELRSRETASGLVGRIPFTRYVLPVPATGGFLNLRDLVPNLNLELAAWRSCSGPQSLGGKNTRVSVNTL